jgi:hypothetical protein
LVTAQSIPVPTTIENEPLKLTALKLMHVITYHC